MRHSVLYSVLTRGICPVPVANTDDKAPQATDNLPPITKGLSPTVGAAMVPSVVATSTITNDGSPAEPGTDASAKTESPAANADPEDVSEKISKSDNPGPEPEKPVDPAPTPVSQPVTTDTVTSDTPALSNGNTVQPPKPVSVEEVHDEDLPKATDLESGKLTSDVPVTDAPAPVIPTGVEANEASTVNSDPAKTTGKKRKAEDVQDLQDVAQDETNNNVDNIEAPPEKKQKPNGSAPNGGARKPGRPKKDKNKAPVIVGRTLRKTRSQGAVDAV